MRVRGEKTCRGGTARDYCAETGCDEGTRIDESGAVAAAWRLGASPGGGACCTISFLDAFGHPVDEAEAAEAVITEQDEDGRLASTTYRSLLTE
jgi:hypothetical protein